MFVRALVFASLVAVTFPATAQDTFVPSRYKAQIEAAHAADSQGHVLKVRILTHAVTNMSDGSVKVTGLTQILDGKTGNLVSQSRCSPCEEKATAWPDRPTGVWFTEASWPTGSTVARAKALMLMSHFDRYFKLVRMDGTEKNGITYQFWKFEGRRGVPLPDADADAEKAKAEAKPKGPKFGPVQQVQIFFGQSKPDTVTTAVGEDSVQLKAVAYAAPEGSAVLSEVSHFFPMWSASCGKISDPRQKQITFTLAAGTDRCRVFLYEGMTGKHDQVTVVRGQRPRPPVRVAITFGGGREADGVVLQGGQNTLELEAHAFRPDGSENPGLRARVGRALREGRAPRRPEQAAPQAPRGPGDPQVRHPRPGPQDPRLRRLPHPGRRRGRLGRDLERHRHRLRWRPGIRQRRRRAGRTGGGARDPADPPAAIGAARGGPRARPGRPRRRPRRGRPWPGRCG